MVPRVRRLLVAATMTAVLLGVTSARAQQLPPAPIPVPVLSAADPTAPAPSHVIPAQADSPAPPSPVRPAPLVGPLGRVPSDGPGLGSPPVLMPPPPPEPLPTLAAPPGCWADRTSYPPPGWFAGVELDIVGPHVKNRLIADVPFANGLVDTVHLPMAPLDWTVSPRFEAGYRFANNGGQFSAVYRFLATDGNAPLIDLDTGTLGSLRSRLDFNVVDFTYGNGLIAPGPYSDVQWSVGVRLAQAFFDSRARDALREARTSNHFFGAGPLGAIEWWRRLDVPGLAVYSRLEGAVPVGSIHQGYEEVIRLSRASFLGGATSQRQTQAVPTLSFDIGLGWTPHWSRFSRFSFGYHLERWWELGDVNDASADLTTQGLFFKGEFSF